MEQLIVQARAKINLTMDVLYRRDDGYHQVDLLMQSISLCDTLHFTPGKALTLTIEGDLPVDDENLVLRAARLLAQDAGVEPRAHIHLQKRIPVAAGLGGGSGDAAAALIGLNRLWGLDLPLERLLKLGASLGADVPFCMLGGCQRAQGIGTELTAVQNRVPLHLVVVKPCQGLLTKEIFCALQLGEQTRHPDTQGAVKAVEAGEQNALLACMGNVLEAPAMQRRPEIRQVMEELTALGALQARMSGSGPTVFGLFPTREQAAEAAIVLKRRYPECFAAENATHGVKLIG